MTHASLGTLPAVSFLYDHQDRQPFDIEVTLPGFAPSIGALARFRRGILAVPVHQMLGAACQFGFGNAHAPSLEPGVRLDPANLLS